MQLHILYYALYFRIIVYINLHRFIDYVEYILSSFLIYTARHYPKGHKNTKYFQILISTPSPNKTNHKCFILIASVQ